MDAIDYLFYGYGQVVYATALSDGKIQDEERQALIKSINAGLKEQGINYDVAAIVFHLMEKPRVFNAEEAYKDGLKNMSFGSHKITPAIHAFMLNTLRLVAESFPPIAARERDFLSRFEKDILSLN